MGIQEITKVPKSQSKNSFYGATKKWEQTSEVIQLTTQNGGASITDEIPGGGTVKQRIAAHEKQIRSNTVQSNASNSHITTSSSGTSILSQSPLEKNHDAKKTKHSNKPRIPIRSNSSASSSSNNSVVSHSSLYETPSRIPTPILTRKNPNSLFNNNLNLEIKNRTAKTIKIYEINKDKRWVLISPNHRFVSQCRPKTTPALTYREHEKIRVERLSNKEIKMLELMQTEDNSEKNKEIRFLGKK